jgi:hypothetical protein
MGSTGGGGSSDDSGRDRRGVCNPPIKKRHTRLGTCCIKIMKGVGSDIDIEITYSVLRGIKTNLNNLPTRSSYLGALETFPGL